MDDAERLRRGMSIRREVLGDEHVDGAVDRTTPFTAPANSGAGCGDIHERSAQRELAVLVFVDLSAGEWVPIVRAGRRA